jgi:hypothetical protein
MFYSHRVHELGYTISFLIFEVDLLFLFIDAVRKSGGTDLRGVGSDPTPPPRRNRPDEWCRRKVDITAAATV